MRRRQSMDVDLRRLVGRGLQLLWLQLRYARQENRRDKRPFDALVWLACWFSTIHDNPPAAIGLASDGRATSPDLRILVYRHLLGRRVDCVCDPRCLDQWLADRGLTLAQNIDGNGSWSPIDGEYRETSHMDQIAFDALDGLDIRLVDNGQYTRGVITTDADGIRTEHHMNCNVKTRRFYDYRESRNMIVGNPAV